VREREVMSEGIKLIAAERYLEQCAEGMDDAEA
jgi:hypothetical protein